MNRAHDPEQVKADAKAIYAGRCPERGTDLSHMTADAIRLYVAHTFPQFDPASRGSSDYERRARLILSYADSIGRGTKDGY